MARLAQDTLLKRQNDVFWSRPIAERIDRGMQPYLDAIWRRVRKFLPHDMGTWPPFLADTWISTLCRILISIQRYRHGGAILITGSESDLDIKYRLNYRRLPKALVNLGVNTIRNHYAQQESLMTILTSTRRTYRRTSTWMRRSRKTTSKITATRSRAASVSFQHSRV